MTNGEKIQQIFPRKCPHIGFNENFGRIWLMQDGEDFANFTLKWWNAEYKEPTTRNCFGCKYATDNHNSGTEECHLCMWENQYTSKQEPILDKIRAELHATAEMHEDGDYYLRDEWIDEYFDKYKAKSEDKE